MKKHFFVSIALFLIVSAASCNKDDEIVSEIPGQTTPDNEESAATPLVSLAVPSDGFFLLPGEQHFFSPSVSNAEDPVYLWTINNLAVSDEPVYTFCEEKEGHYTLTFTAATENAATTITIPITVTNDLPVSAVIPTPLFFSDSKTRYTAPGQTIWLRAYVSPSIGINYAWSVNGEVITGENELLFAFTPEYEGSYDVVFTAESASVGVSVETPVICVQPSSRQYSETTDGFHVIEFVPAPGQFINDKTSGYNGVSTPQSAADYAQKRLDENLYLSLGAWGGSVTVRCPRSIENSGAYDFAIAGNSFDGSSEPGIVMVMQDINGNGIPDEQWYELKGSNFENNDTEYFYNVTYYRPGEKAATPWVDSNGAEGYIYRLASYHDQDFYYPEWISTPSYTLYGTRLPAKSFQDPATGIWINYPYAWGYADNFGDDATTIDLNGSNLLLNHFRISDAINPDGTPANLQHIDFIKVQSAINSSSGWLGELSTEVCGFFIENE